MESIKLNIFMFLIYSNHCFIELCKLPNICLFHTNINLVKFEEKNSLYRILTFKLQLNLSQSPLNFYVLS